MLRNWLKRWRRDGGRARRSAARLVLEALEDRTLLASPVYVNAAWAGLTPGTQPAGSPPGTVIGVNGFSTIQAGVNAADAGGTVFVEPGTYRENVTIAKSLSLYTTGSSVILDGAATGGTGLTVSGDAGTSVILGALTVQNFTADLSASGLGSLALVDLTLAAGGAGGGTVQNVANVYLNGSAGPDTLIASGTQFGLGGNALLTGAGIGTLTLAGLGGGDTYRVDLNPGGPGSPQAAQNVSVLGSGTGGSDALDVTDTPGGDTLVLSAPLATGSSATPEVIINSNTSKLANLVYRDVATIDVTTGDGPMTVDAFGALPGATTSVATGAGADQFNVDVEAFVPEGLLQLDGGGGTNTLQVAPILGAAAGDNMVVTADAVYSPTFGYVVAYTPTFTGGVSVATAPGASTVNVQGTVAGATTTVTTQGTDRVNVSSPAGTLDTLRGPLSVVAAAGAATLYVSEAGATAGDTVYLTADSIGSGSGSFIVNYTAAGGSFAGGVYVVTGAGNDTVNVLGTSAPFTVIDTEGGDDTVVVGYGGTVAPVAGPVLIDAGAGANQLLVNDIADQAGDTFAVNASTITSQAGLFVSYTASGGSFSRGISLQTGGTNVTINVQGTLAGVLTSLYATGQSNDTINVSSPQGTLDTVRGPLYVDTGFGHNHMTVSEAGTSVSDAIIMDGQAINSSVVGFNIYYNGRAGFDSFALVTGSGNDSIDFVGGPSFTPVIISTGAGNDFVRVHATDQTGSDVNVAVDGGPPSTLPGDVIWVIDEAGNGTFSRTTTGTGSGTIEVDYPFSPKTVVTYTNMEQAYASERVS